MEQNYTDNYTETNKEPFHDDEEFKLSNANPPQIIRKDIFCESVAKENDDRAFLLYNILTEQECEYIISEAEKKGPKKVLGSDNYRNNSQVIFQSTSMSECMWERIKDQIKPILLEPGDYKQTVEGFKLEGLWEPYGFNTHWRISKYNEGGHFGPHYDGSTIFSSNLRSLKTFNLYLNGNFSKGTTNFIKDKQETYKNSQNQVVAEEENICYRVVPEAGMALIFNHYILHEGENVVGGMKYIFRSDILFRRNEPPQLCDSESLAISYLEQAKACENEGDFEGAVKWYKKAFRLCPTLEDKKVT